MVTVELDRADRGQILLVGALAIAFILIGLAVLFNSVTYVSQSSIPDTQTSIDDATQFDYEAKQGTRELILRVNHRTVYPSPSEVGEYVSNNVSNYSAILGATYSGRGAAVNVSFDNSTSEYGRRIVQADQGNFTDDGSPGGSSTWILVNKIERMGWFVVNVNATTLSKTSGGAFTVTVSNSTADIEYHIYEGSKGGVNVSVEKSWSGTTTLHRFNSTRGHVVLDLLDGTSPMNRSTRMVSVRALEGNVSVAFSNGDAGAGLYSIVLPRRGPIKTGNIGACSATGTFPCHHPVLWNVTIETQYTSPNVNMTHNQTIPVYNSTT